MKMKKNNCIKLAALVLAVCISFFTVSCGTKGSAKEPSKDNTKESFEVNEEKDSVKTDKTDKTDKIKKDTAKNDTSIESGEKSSENGEKGAQTPSSGVSEVQQPAYQASDPQPQQENMQPQQPEINPQPQAPAEQPSQPQQQTPTEPPKEEPKPTHVHQWEDIVEIRHHEEQGEWREVEIEPAWDEEVYEYKSVCKVCGAYFDTAREVSFHLSEAHDDEGSYGSMDVLVDTIHHEAVIEQQWVVTQEAYDEEVKTGQQKCSICGEIK